MLLIDIARTSFLAQLPYALHAETFYYAALAFGIGTPLALATAAWLGNAAASVLTLGLGHWLAGINAQREKPAFQRLRRFVETYLVWLLLIPGLGMRGLCVLVFASIGVRWQKLLAIVLVEHALRYGITAFVTHNGDILAPFLFKFL